MERKVTKRWMRLLGFSIAAISVLWVFNVFFCTISLADQRKGINVVIKDRSGREVGLYKESYALVIGVSKYTAGWPNLESVPGEIDRIEGALKKQGFAVVKVLNPTSIQLRTAFENFINKYGFEEDNRLFFFFSGHGHTHKRGKKGYLVPADAPDPRSDDRGFVQKALGMGQILTWSRRIEAKHALFVFDSCFSGMVFKAKSLPKHPSHITSMIARPVRQFITAGSAGEEIPARSVFVPSFIRAIKGEGDLDKDGYITGTEIGMYLHKKVISYQTYQTPQYGKIRDPDLDEGDFIFVINKKELVNIQRAKMTTSDSSLKLKNLIKASPKVNELENISVNSKFGMLVLREPITIEYISCADGVTPANLTRSAKLIYVTKGDILKEIPGDEIISCVEIEITYYSESYDQVTYRENTGLRMYIHINLNNGSLHPVAATKIGQGELLGLRNIAKKLNLHEDHPVYKNIPDFRPIFAVDFGGNIGTVIIICQYYWAKPLHWCGKISIYGFSRLALNALFDYRIIGTLNIWPPEEDNSLKLRELLFADVDNDGIKEIIAKLYSLQPSGIDGWNPSNYEGKKVYKFDSQKNEFNEFVSN